jgi:antitoxin component YwqK of YwqJK toxin-antitoxin module
MELNGKWENGKLHGDATITYRNGTKVKVTYYNGLEIRLNN